jgi:hypothetical protein
MELAERWTRSRQIKVGLAAFAFYFAVAGYLKYTYVPQPDPPKDHIWLEGPFIRYEGSKAGYIAILPKLDAMADRSDDPFRSPLIVYENNIALGPAHTVHADIANGRFSHWEGLGVVFSASDNSDPNTNWKNYSVGRPKS